MELAKKGNPMNVKGNQFNLVPRFGQPLIVTNESADDYRINQMLSAGWQPASLVCCRLGIPNPFGLGSGAELREVRLERLPPQNAGETPDV